jgi:DNA-binding NtrC family response regulator
VRVNERFALPERSGSTNLGDYEELVGSSPPMLALFAQLRRLEASLVNVLIEGESGTGKELVARAIHKRSAVATGQLVSVNCGAIERTLAQSVLFGHRRGAFTSALDAHVGAFEAASNGTLFLDEVAELPLDVQPSLLRALEVGAFVRVGEHEERPVSVRVIAATNRDLEMEVQKGRFREDLYYRLLVAHVRVPPLRERPSDVPLLARSIARRDGLSDLPEAVQRELATRTWRGNVRELRNAIQVYGALGTLPEPRRFANHHPCEALATRVDVNKPYALQKEELLLSFLRVYLAELLEHTGGNQSLAARISGFSRSHLNKLIQKLEVTACDLP